MGPSTNILRGRGKHSTRSIMGNESSPIRVPLTLRASEGFFNLEKTQKQHGPLPSATKFKISLVSEEMGTLKKRGSFPEEGNTV